MDTLRGLDPEGEWGSEGKMSRVFCGDSITENWKLRGDSDYIQMRLMTLICHSLSPVHNIEWRSKEYKRHCGK